MKRGFFTAEQVSVVSKADSMIPRCGQCGLYRTCKAPRMLPYGMGKKKILIVGEAPGRTEDEYIEKDQGKIVRRGRQFIGKSGQYLRDILTDCGIDMDEDCWATNSLICRPPGNKLPSNPTSLIEACRPNLLRTVKELSPNVVILLGGVACKSLIPHLWKDEVGQAGIWGGWRIPSHVINAWVCPTFHPAYILRQPGPTLEMKFRQDLGRAAKLKSKPWDAVPDWPSKVERIFRPLEAVKSIQEMVRQAKIKKVPIAADYETNCLKPEYEGAEIICCSMSIGSWTIAYPWAGEAIDATSEMWQSDPGKVASNMKFEDRWTRYFLRHPVRHWYWDTMIAAHVLDNRDGVTNVKFQGFVQCGAKYWAQHVDDKLESKNGRHLNRIRELDLRDLLLYNGLDSRIEWEVCKKQVRQMERQNVNATGVY